MPITVHHNGELDIAVGKNRKETRWRNLEMQWSELLDKLSTTHVTAETHAEYMKSTKTRQDEIKDIGGFVGGYLTGGRRKAGTVLHRQLVTLDIDFATPHVWDDFTMLYGNAACIYSTHKHTPEHPRLRLIMPLDRPVFADEYVAITRRLAGMIGIDMFDHTTYQPERLMYWPSTSKDGVYIFEHQDGPWLSADEVLSTYRNWRDSSEWPVSAREGDVTLRAIKKQGDPLEKPGLVGAFCRTYTISEAIETLLTDVYEPCGVEGRYTYIGGSTAAGLVTYEDKYAYSHHGTDPVSGKLCNAFDLVRLHLFGLKDEEVDPDVPVNKRPSYTEMVLFATRDAAVRKQLGVERIESAASDFADLDTDEQQEVSTDWLAELEVDSKGNYLSTINNVLQILGNDPRLKGRLSYDDFEKREIALKALPWRAVGDTNRYLTDADDAGIRHYLESVYGISAAQKIQDALSVHFISNRIHPVRDYLDGLHWDGTPRVDSLLIDYMGVEDSAYTRAITRKTLTAAVARIYRPGCKFDYVLTLVGEEGKGKSTLFKILGRKWFSDSFSGVQGKEAYEQLQGVWLVEMAELAGLKRADVEAVKHFVSKGVDRFRVAYGRRTEDFPRQCIFLGSTNEMRFLRGANGNRRFWPAVIWEHEPARQLSELTDYEVGQIWAEAVEIYRAGEPLYLTPELEAVARQVQQDHNEQDDRAGLVQHYLDTLLPETWDDLNVYERRQFLQGQDDLIPEGTVQRTRVCVGEIWCEALGGQLKDMTRFNTKDIHDIMKRMPGWVEHKSKIKNKLYGVQKGYVRVNAMEHVREKH